jgi:hypothetical protein
VPAGASGDVGVTLKAPTTTVAHAPLLLAAAFRNSAGQILAQASDAKAMYVTAVLSYSLTTTGNPAHPGQVANFTVAVTNRSSVAKAIYFYYDVPQFTTDSGYPAGTTFQYNMGNVAAGATQSVTFSFTVLSGTQAPPNGSLITLVVTDRANGALVSRTVAVNFTLAMLERPASPRGRLVLANPLTEAPLIFAVSSSNHRDADSVQRHPPVRPNELSPDVRITARSEPVRTAVHHRLGSRGPACCGVRFRPVDDGQTGSRAVGRVVVVPDRKTDQRLG